MSTRIEGIIDRLTDAESFDDIKWIVGDGIVRNYAQSIVDDHIKANAEFQGKAGLEVTVERVSVGKTCKWCLARCGKFTYPDVPKGTWDRHVDCDCYIIYDNGRVRQTLSGKDTKWNVVSEEVSERKKVGLTKPTAKELEARKIVGLEPKRKPVFVPAETIEDAKQYANDTLGLRTSLDYKKMNVDVANIVNEELTKAYEMFGDLHEADVLNELYLVTGKKPFVAAYNGPMKTLIFTRENTGFKSSLKKMQKDAIFQKEAGFWSTGEKEQSIRHEIGHAVERKYYRGNEELEKAITELRMSEWDRIGIKEWSMETPLSTIKKGGEKLSFYGISDNSEFIAESVAEYMSGNPRETARKVVELLLK